MRRLAASLLIRFYGHGSLDVCSHGIICSGKKMCVAVWRDFSQDCFLRENIYARDAYWFFLTVLVWLYTIIQTATYLSGGISDARI